MSLGGSVLRGVATGLPELIVFRVLQGVGGGMVMPVTISILARAARPERIDRAMIAVALPAPLAPILGSVAGDAILDAWSRPWLFLVNVPICVAALVLGPLLLPAAPARRGHRLDVLGLGLLSPAVAGIAYEISEAAGDEGFAAARAWGPMALGRCCWPDFTVHALRSRHPAPGAASGAGSDGPLPRLLAGEFAQGLGSAR